MPRGPLSFFQLPFPYLDCAAIGFRDTGVARRTEPTLRKSLSEHDLDLCGGETPNSTTYLVVSRKRLRTETDTTVYSGIGNVCGRIAFGQTGSTLPSEDTHELRRSVGQFTFFKRDVRHIECGHDLYGNGHIYASQHATSSILSNRLHLHRIVLRSLEACVEANETTLASLLFSNHVFFAQQNIGSATLVDGVTQVSLDSIATIRDGELTLERNQYFLDCLEPSPKHYDELVELGTADIIANTRAVLEDSSFKNVIVDLSGGKDSRLVFGSCLHHPAWRDRTRIFTKDVPNSRDLEIACGIASLFQASHFDGIADLYQAPFSIDENLNLWRSYFFGIYHRMGAGAWTSAGRNLSTISLSGGCGEILRTFWSKSIGRKLNENEETLAFARRVTSENGIWSLVDRSYEDAIAAQLGNTITSLPGATTRDKLETHYLYFRNRAHFGMRGFSAFHEHATWFPLMSPHLLRAASSLSFQEREGGRLVADITERLHPILPQIEYDGAASQFTTRAYTATRTPLRVPLDTNRNAWLEATASARASLDNARRTSRATMRWSEWPLAVESAAAQAFEEARAASRVCHELLKPAYIDAMRTAFAAGQRNAFVLASRMMAVRDVVCD